MKQHHKQILFIFLILVLASSLGIYLRLYTLRNNVPHDIEEQATIRVITNLRAAIKQQVDKSYPALSPIEKQRIAKEQFDQILHNEKQKVRDSINRAAIQLKNSDPSIKNPFYLAEADSYYYYNLTENILDTGKISGKIQGSKYFNALMNAPHGYWEPLNLHPYVGLIVYKIVHFFQPGIPLMEGVSYTPIFLTVFIISAFLLGTMILECSAWASLWGALTLICIPVFLRRSMFGWYKNDPANIFFLFIIPAILFYGLKHIDRRRTALLSAAACSFLLTLYSLFWQGWVFLASLIAVSGIGIIAHSFFFQREKRLTKSFFLYFSLVLGAAFAGVSIVFGPKEFFVLFKEGWAALQDFINPQFSMWPDLYIAVGELLSPTPEQWLEMMGGIVFIAISVIGLTGRTIELFRKPADQLNPPAIFIIAFWLVGVKLSFGAQRFCTLCLIPLSLTFAIGAHYILKFIDIFILKKLPLIKRSPAAQISVIAVLIAATSFFFFKNAQATTPEILNKIFNSTWDAALTKIKKETPNNSIINTWWPPGHFIKGIARRSVTFDGATINKPQSYWIANALLATDERTAAGILRMINSSGNDAVEFLLKENFSLSQAVDLIKKIVALNEDQARRVLVEKLTPKQIDGLVRLTHGKAPPSYLLIYNDMVQDSLQFNFVGNWDFKKVEAINKDPALLSNIPKHGSKDYVPFLWKIAGGPPRYTDILVPVVEKGRAIIFENNILVDLDTMTSTINSAKYGQGVPHHLFYEQGHDFIEKEMPNATLPISVMLINDKTGPKCKLADTSLARSLLMRLYYFGGKGLQLFEPFDDVQDATGRTRIVVYKINWDHF